MPDNDTRCGHRTPLLHCDTTAVVCSPCSVSQGGRRERTRFLCSHSARKREQWFSANRGFAEKAGSQTLIDLTTPRKHRRDQQGMHSGSQRSRTNKPQPQPQQHTRSSCREPYRDKAGEQAVRLLQQLMGRAELADDTTVQHQHEVSVDNSPCTRPYIIMSETEKRRRQMPQWNHCRLQATSLPTRRALAMDSTAQHSTTQHNTTQHNATQHNTTQHSTTQHNTTQHNTTQHRVRPHPA